MDWLKTLRRPWRLWISLEDHWETMASNGRSLKARWEISPFFLRSPVSQRTPPLCKGCIHGEECIARSDCTDVLVDFDIQWTHILYDLFLIDRLFKSNAPIWKMMHQHISFLFSIIVINHIFVNALWKQCFQFSKSLKNINNIGRSFSSISVLFVSVHQRFMLTFHSCLVQRFS